MRLGESLLEVAASFIFEMFSKAETCGTMLFQAAGKLMYDSGVNVMKN